MAALVVAALAGVGDRPAWLAAILADRYARPHIVIAAAALALLAASGIAAALGRALGPMLTPEAKQLMLAVALMAQGAGALRPPPAPDPLTGWRLPAALVACLGLFILLFGDGVQFVVATLAARSSMPALAAVGATLGALAPIAIAACLGEQAWMALPLARARAGIGVILAIAALWLGLGALRLL